MSVGRLLYWRTALLLAGPDGVVSPGVATATGVPVSVSLGTTRRSRVTLQVSLRSGPGPGRVRIRQVTPGGLELRHVQHTVPAGRARRLVLALADADESRLEVKGLAAASSIFDWSDVAIERRRTATELRRIARGAFAQYGVRGTFRRLWMPPPSRSDGHAYRQWLTANDPDVAQLQRWRTEAAALADGPTISILTPVHDTEPAALRACWRSVLEQIYPNWEWCLCDDGSTEARTLAVLDEILAAHDSRVHLVRLPQSRHISVATNAAASRATGEFLALLDHDDTLSPDALFHVARTLRATPFDLLYSDEDKLDETGQRCEPAFKPDWSPELLRSYMYTCHLTVIRRRLFERLGGLRHGFEGAQDYDLWLRASAETGAIGHIPRVLYHWRKSPYSTATSTLAKPEGLSRSKAALEEDLQRRSVRGTVETGSRPGLWHVRRTLDDEPLVSIVLPTDGDRRQPADRNLLVACVRSLVQRTSYRRFEIVVAHNGYLPDAVQPWLDRVPHVVRAIPAEHPFNFARKLNRAAAAASGDYLLILNDDVEVTHDDWLLALLEHGVDPGVGVVGARLDYPDGRIQHAGLLLGVCGVAAHAYHGAAPGTEGYLSNILTTRNCSAVTGACLLTRRTVFDQLGGFDEAFPIDFNDVDYCLRVRRLGLRVVYAPRARLTHHESGTIGSRAQATSEVEAFRQRWGALLERDPYYNPNLTYERPDWSLGRS